MRQDVDEGTEGLRGGQRVSSRSFKASKPTHPPAQTPHPRVHFTPEPSSFIRGLRHAAFIHLIHLQERLAGSIEEGWDAHENVAAVGSDASRSGGNTSVALRC